MNQLFTQETLAEVQHRLRRLRESRQLSLLEVEKISQGSVTAISLGSYERGDRQVSVSKLIHIANVYQVPVTEFFDTQQEERPQMSITIDIRKIIKSSDADENRVIEVIRRIAKQRGDWNGEVMSLRSSDTAHLELFTGLSRNQVQEILTKYKFPRLK